MSVRVFSSVQILWFRCTYSIIIRNLKEKLRELDLEDNESFQSNGEKPMEIERKENNYKRRRFHLLWRLGHNLYKSCSYSDGLRALLELTHQLDELKDNKERKIAGMQMSDIVNVHQTIGKCAIYLFLETSKHEHLELAHQHYQWAVNNIPVGLTAMYTVPILLIEYGLVLEYYGAFEAAMDNYCKILTLFPNCGSRYFDALYRTAIVGKHLASINSNDTEKEETVNKCIDILQFLLEALPTNINDLHIVLLYARVFEMSSSTQAKFRAQAVYLTLFDICRRKDIADASICTDVKSWLSEPRTWLALAENIEAAGEILIAKDAFTRFVDEARRRVGNGKDLTAALDATACIKLSRHFAKYQDIEEAKKYAELGFKIDRYNKEVRQLLAQWNIHADLLNKEESAARVIISVWKGRCWSSGFRKMLKDSVLKDMEERLHKNHFDLEARRKLAYYARDKYRARFIFEDACAAVIQQKFRQRRKNWVFEEVQRRHYTQRATEIQQRYRRQPFVLAIREEVLLISKNKFISRRHAVHAAAKQIKKEIDAVSKLKRGYKSFVLRRCLHQRVLERQRRYFLSLSQHAVKIQSVVRRHFGQRHAALRKEQHMKRVNAAKCLQQFWRRYLGHFKTIANRALSSHQRWDRRDKYFMSLKAKKMIGRLIRRFLTMKALRTADYEMRKRKFMDRVKVLNVSSALVISAMRIQRFIRKRQLRRRLRGAKNIISQRLSCEYSKEVGLFLSHHLQRSPEETLYRAPGMDTHSKSFIKLLHQHTVLCPSERFALLDLQLLGLVLANPQCRIQRVILSKCRLYQTFAGPSAAGEVPENHTEKALGVFFSSLIKCKSIRSLWLLGGEWSSAALTTVCRIAQVDNPRIRELVLEKVGHSAIRTLSLNVANIFKDYFNFSLPGLSMISLHGATLRNDQAILLGEGLAVTSSLTSCVLSLNFFTDEGFLALFDGVKSNKHGSLEVLDVSWNLIELGIPVLYCLESYRRPNPMTNKLLRIDFTGNQVHHNFDSIESALQHGQGLQLEVICPRVGSQSEYDTAPGHNISTEYTNPKCMHSIPPTPFTPLPTLVPPTPATAPTNRRKKNSSRQ